MNDHDDLLEYFTMQRCLVAHFGLGRGPLSFAWNNAYANNLIYDMNRMSDFGSFGHAIRAVVAKSLYVGGTTAIEGTPVNAQFGLPEGSAIHVSGLRAFNLAGVDDGDQRSFVDSVLSAEYWADAPPSGVIPEGWGEDLSSVDDIPADTAGKLELVEKLRVTCGVQRRNAPRGFVDLVCDQVQSRLLGETPPEPDRLIDTPSDAGGIPSPDEFLISLTNREHIDTYHGGNVIPGVADRDVVQSNGRTAGENWVMALRALHYGR
jgi:hypothetical protein